MAGESALDRVSTAAERIARLEPWLTEARRELHAAILEAHAEGVSIVVIAAVGARRRARLNEGR